MNDYVLVMRGVTVDRRSGRNILSIDRLAVRQGELVAVVGPNGAGKSTLLQTVNLHHAFNGEIALFGQTVDQADKTVLRRRCAMVFQETLLLNDTVYNNVACALKFRGTAPSKIEQLVQAAMADFRCDHLANRSARSLSGGEAQRVSLARAVVTDPELLLLDEPFAALDATARGEMIEEIRQLAKARGITVILVSHNFSEVLHFADRALVVFGGSVIQDGKPEYVMRKPVNEQVARLVGMDNIIPCRIEADSDQRFIRLADGISFLYQAEKIGAVSACCIPGDMLYPYQEGVNFDDPGRWVIVEGIVERIVPGVGSYRVLVKLGQQILNARVPRSFAVGNLAGQQKIKLAFQPADVHLI